MAMTGSSLAELKEVLLAEIFEKLEMGSCDHGSGSTLRSAIRRARAMLMGRRRRWQRSDGRRLLVCRVSERAKGINLF